MAGTRIPLLIIDRVNVQASGKTHGFNVEAFFHINSDSSQVEMQFSCQFDCLTLPGGTQRDLGYFVQELLFEKFRAAETAIKPAGD